ncbi:MAG TPA: MBL fold metallo-hydrolase [Gaiellaceae bacterium]|nr:MBL fold metallo-hydrolase [Gaiellaceae bacterium]
MKLTVVGCSPAWPNPGGAQSGYLVEADRRLLLDCGPGVLAKLRELDDGWPQIDAIVITHWHLDHWGDLVPWVWGTMSGPGRDLAKVELWLPPGGEGRLREFGSRLGWEEMWETAFRLREYAEGGPFEAAGLTVTAIRVPHYTLTTYGLRVTNGARSLAYSGDSGPSDRLAELARDVDLFICEATLARGDLDGSPRGHLSADEAMAAFEASGARRLLLTHRPHELPVADGVEQAQDGLELEV